MDHTYPMGLLVHFTLSHCTTATRPCTSHAPAIDTQNTVPSLTISIGGPPDSGLFSFAISRPPFHVALSSTCARESCSFDKLSLTRICSAIRSLIGVSAQRNATQMSQLIGEVRKGKEGRRFQRAMEDDGWGYQPAMETDCGLTVL